MLLNTVIINCFAVLNLPKFNKRFRAINK
uniref:Uncharacterized protein n=1 Tax=Anguilla anguilla TaxID=7936 RepID=A0A0E9TYW8_ANGAN